MKINPDFVSPCGLYCGVCAIYIAHRDNNQKFKEKLVGLYKGSVPGKGTLPNSENLTAEDIQCQGCLSENLFMHCKQCEIRDCTMKKGYAGCHQCDEFPCPEKWIKDEEARYFCPECGHKVFRGVVKCNQCKAKLDLD
jgi:hypothetical protein